MSHWLRQLVLLLTGTAVLEMLLPRGGMNRVCRLALGMGLMASALAALGGWQMPENPAAATASIWRSGSPYEAAVYEEQVIRAWQALEEMTDEHQRLD